jgi:hypothetical protein
MRAMDGKDNNMSFFDNWDRQTEEMIGDKVTHFGGSKSDKSSFSELDRLKTEIRRLKEENKRLRKKLGQ